MKESPVDGAKAVESTDSLKVRIRELEKEVERWKSEVKKVRYGLCWQDVPEAFDKDSEDKIPILEEVSEKAIDARGPLAGRPPHVIIEGDNYHALTCLNYTHRGKIDVIYIDPPYNTGSDGFTYKDRRFLTEFPDGQKVPREHPLRHSYWLSFMEKRLRLAKNLLSDKGVIFISIDDNEQANLKLLCDKIFGEGNLICCFIWKSKSGGANDSRFVAVDHEYVLCYAKKSVNIGKMLDKNVEVSTSYNYEDEKGVYSLERLDKQSIRYSKSLDFKIIGPDGKSYMPKHKDPKNPNATWRWSKDKVKENMDELVFKNGCVYTKNYKKEANLARSILFDEKYGRTRTGKTDLSDLFDTEVFKAPKPIKLLLHLISISTYSNPHITILDFFAGSGTTLHATLNLNKEDGGNRRCILVQQAEGDNNICESVTYERNRRVMCGYTNAKGESVEGLGGSLKYYKTGFIGKHPSKNASDADKVELAEKAGCLIALAENTLETVAVPQAASGFFQIYADNAERKRYTCIYHNGDYERVPEFIDRIDALRATDKKSKFTVYVFSWNSPDFFENEFDDLTNIEIKAIPKPILEIYKALNG